ncbi:MAG TPA: helix-turn-helix domain-containing protein [Burkholderiales bacterium]|nr:helix-turn-helix domain-containing protein [Burkholderiales bacterium]
MGAAVIAIHPVEKRMPAAPKHAASCSSCNLRELCLPGALDGEDLARVDHLVYARRRLKRGEALYQAGTEFNAIYAIRSGSFKASLFDGEGHEQVSGFFMGGELLGLEGLGSGSYQASAIALEDSEICVLPYSLIEQLCREIPALQRRLHTVLAREIVRDHGVMMLLGTMRAEQRLATFLLNLSARSKRRGYSSSDFHLRMSREEMGSYLGLKLETVSRLFSQFHEARLIEVDYRHVRIVDVQGLQRLVSS